MRCGVELSSTAGADAGGLQNRSSVASCSSQRFAPKGRVVGDLSRRRTERIRTTVTSCESVTGCGPSSPQPSALAGARSFLWILPTFNVDPNASRNRYSGNRPEVVTLGRPLTQSTFEIPFLLNYEPDLFGKVRRSLQASNASLQSTAADLYNVNLVLTA